ncbi:MAG: endonuclease domain-containing protein [Hyphomonadaceae bacterium]
MAQPPTKGILRDRARGMRKQPSRAERAVWEIVRDNRLGFKFRRQRPISRYIADFACMEAKLIIEIDGPSHDVAGQIEYDAERTTLLNSLGWRVLRIRDALVLTDASAAAALILEALRQPSP